MGHSTGTPRSADGLELYCETWGLDTKPRAAVAILHGIGGHGGQSTYTHLFDRLMPLGYALYGVDLRGHGRSEGDGVPSRPSVTAAESRFLPMVGWLDRQA